MSQQTKDEFYTLGGGYPMHHALLAILCLTLTLSLTIRPLVAESSSWDIEIPNLTGVCRYKVLYEIPDTISTNTTHLAKVTFLVVQLGGTTESIKTQTIEMQLDAKGKLLKWTIAQQVQVLHANQTWGPFVYQFKILDSDLDLKPNEAVSTKISITVKFKEIGILSIGEYTKEVKKEDIRAELRSTTALTSIDYLKDLISVLAGSWPLMIAISIFIVITVGIYIKITIRKTVKL